MNLVAWLYIESLGTTELASCTNISEGWLDLNQPDAKLKA
jgi:hypothetical protein